MFDISRFSEYREDNRMEVKKAGDGLPASLWETYSSFANCSGGVIILGVRERKDGTWESTGLENEGKLRKEFWDCINNKKKVSVNLLTDSDMEVYEEDGKIIMVLHVPKARREQKPVYINGNPFGGTFRRNWEGDYHCTREEVLGMLRDQPENTSDMKVLADIPMEDLDYETIRGYRNRHMACRPGHPWEKLEDHSFLERIGAAAIAEKDGRLHPTAAGLLMFGEEYRIVREYPGYFLDYREVLDPAIRWTDRVQSSSGDWTGNLFDFYFRIYNKLVKDIKIPFKMEGGNRIDDTPVHKALREALANCLVNADYYGSRGVVIKKERDFISMENPGSIRTGKAQMLKGGISDPRNKALMKMFNMINIGERAGSGVPDIFSVWEQEGWQAPEVTEEFGPDRTLLVLPLISKKRRKSGDKKTAIKSGDKNSAGSIEVKPQKDIPQRKQEQYERILAYMEKFVEYRTTDFEMLLGLKSSRVRELLGELVDQGEIIRTGSNKNRRYKRVS